MVYVFFTQTMVRKKFKYYKTYFISLLLLDRSVKLIHIKNAFHFKLKYTK